MSSVTRAPDLADWALSRGRTRLTTAEIADLLQIPPGQVSQRLAAPAARNEWVTPARGLWVPVPPEYRTWGAPPGIEIIDLLADHLEVDYYVGWLSAAELHGAAHHAPQVFQVAVSRPLRDRTLGRTDFMFHTRVGLASTPVVHHPTGAGSASVSSPEATALDVAHDIRLAGGIDNAATVILELDEVAGLDRAELVRLAETRPATAARRLGYVLEELGGRPGLDELADLVADGRPSEARLDPARNLTGPLDRRWQLRLNREVEVDW